MSDTKNSLSATSAAALSQTKTSAEKSYVAPSKFAALNNGSKGQVGISWTEKVPPKEWEQHKDRLRSVIDAQQNAEVLGSTVLIGN